MGKQTKDDQKQDYREVAKLELYKKGVNQMASENLNEAIKSFDLALRLDPNYVDALLKKGYCHFLKEEFSIAHACYDKVLDIDPANVEAWNLKGLAYYGEKNYVEALKCVERVIDLDPNNGMAWYNKACYLALMNRVNDALSALKRAIEIDIDYAKKAVRDKDLDNIKGEILFKNIIEIVIIEALRRGYESVGKMVWITGLDRQVIEEALERLQAKGLVIKVEKRGFGFRKEESYELIKELADKLNIEKEVRQQKQLDVIKKLKDMSEFIIYAKNVIEKGDINKSIECMSKLVDASEFGSILIENSAEAHRDLRVYIDRLKSKGPAYLNANKANIIELLNEVEKRLNDKIRKITLT